MGVLEGVNITNKLVEDFERISGKFIKSKNFIKNLDLNKLNVYLSELQKENIKNCGSYLLFHYYLKKDKLQLYNSNFCKNWKLCPACSIRRAYKQRKKFINYIEYNQYLLKKDWFYIVLPVYHNINMTFNEVFLKVKKLIQKIRYRYNKKRGPFGLFVGLLYSIEITNTTNGWNVHINLLGPTISNFNNKINQEYIKRELLYLTGDSYICSVSSVCSDTIDILQKNIMEIFKYCTKFNTLEQSKLFEFYINSKRQRFIGGIGLFYKMKIEEINYNNDDILDDDFVELYYDFVENVYISRKNL